MRAVMRSAAALLAVAMGLGPGGPAQASTAYGEILDFGFLPDEISIGAGDEVVWTNTGDATHTVTVDRGESDAFDSGRLRPGARFSHVFEESATFGYHCDVHPSMKGVVHVSPRPTTTTTTTPETTSTTTTTTPGTTTVTTAASTGSTTERPPVSTATTSPTSAPPTTTSTTRGAAATAPLPIDSLPTNPDTATTATSVGPSVPSASPPAKSGAPVPVSTTSPAGEPAVPEPGVPDPMAPRKPAEGGLEEASGGSGDGRPERKTVAVGIALVGVGALWFLWQLRPRRP